jgi:hypothetical protein
MKNFRPALEALEGIVPFAPRLQLWADHRLLQISAKFQEVNLISETEGTRVRVDESTPETRGPMARECEMEVEDLSSHLGQYAGDGADSREESLQDFLLLLVRPAFTSEPTPSAARSCAMAG